MKVTRQTIIAVIGCFMAASAVAQVTSIQANTPYYIQNVTSGQVLNNGGSTANGSPVTQWNQANSQNLQWQFVPTSGGYYQLQSMQSGLDCVVSQAATTNNAKLVQWTFGSSGDDQWKPVFTNGYFAF